MSHHYHPSTSEIQAREEALRKRYDGLSDDALCLAQAVHIEHRDTIAATMRCLETEHGRHEREADALAAEYWRRDRERRRL